MSLIENFKKVRDIPYKIPINFDDEDCCCNGKARKLKKLIEQEGYKTRYRVCTFRWNDLGIPDDILALSGSDLPTHVYLEVMIDGNWIKVDPTWDFGLRNIFPVSEWDGKNDTDLAVKPIETYSPEESEKIMLQYEPSVVASTRGNSPDKFGKAFNDWLEQKRITFDN